MGAYNWLEASVTCYCCGHEFFDVYQVHIGWCQYHKYKIGDELIWMDEGTRQEIEHDSAEETYIELRTMVEVGSPDWGDFTVSTGEDYKCPQCGAMGSVLAEVKSNKFIATALVPERILYGTVILQGQYIAMIGKLPWQY